MKHNMNYKHLVPVITPLCLWFLSQAFLLWPTFFYAAVALGVLLIVLSIRLLAAETKVMTWPLLIAPLLLFFFSFSVYASLLMSRFWVEVVFVLNVWFAYAYLKNLYYYLVRHEEKRVEKLTNLMLAGTWLTIFAAAATLYDLPEFIDWPFLVLLLIFMVMTGFLWFGFWPLTKIKFRTAAPVQGVSWLVLGALTWLVSLLPLNYNVLGFLTAIIAYFLLELNRAHWRGDLNRRTLKAPLILSAILIIILLLTARWL